MFVYLIHSEDEGLYPQLPSPSVDGLGQQTLSSLSHWVALIKKETAFVKAALKMDGLFDLLTLGVFALGVLSRYYLDISYEISR